MGGSGYIYRNELEYDMVYGNFKDLARWTASDKVLEEHLILLKIQKYDGYQKGLA